MALDWGIGGSPSFCSRLSAMTRKARSPMLIRCNEGEEVKGMAEVKTTFRERGYLSLLVVLFDHFYIVLLSTLEQTHCGLVACL